ncbi:group III truncated hemoglobin [Chitinimonas sp.]|uniref:group III truncated hemoglobin n=1 Tax=Chitinimonas sp. TaxID=1934313 RepID=UPI002F92B1E2
MRDIALEIGHSAVAGVVSDFYDRVVRHPSLAQPFAVVEDWPLHKSHLTHFWWVTLGGERYLDYQYNVPPKHEAAGFTPALLTEWLDLFRTVVRAHLSEALADRWIERAERIGLSLKAMHEFAKGGPRRQHTLAEPAVAIPQDDRP